MPGKDAPAPHGEQAQHDPQQRRVEELLEQGEEDVEEPEHQGGEQDGGPRPVLVLQPGEDEAAERELLADRGNQGEDDQMVTARPGAWVIILPSVILDHGRDREEPLDHRPAAR